MGFKIVHHPAAAHFYSIGIDLAKECQVLLRKRLNEFLESVKLNKECIMQSI